MTFRHHAGSPWYSANRPRIPQRSDYQQADCTAGSDCSATDADRIESWWPSQQRNPVDNGFEGEVLQKWRNIGRFSAVLVRISDCWDAPDENRFTMSRTGGTGIQSLRV